jgi:hypothetical protein
VFGFQDSLDPALLIPSCQWLESQNKCRLQCNLLAMAMLMDCEEHRGITCNTKLIKLVLGSELDEVSDYQKKIQH